MRLYTFIFAVILFSSCDFLSHDNNAAVDNDPSYDAKVVWQSTTTIFSPYFYYVQENNCLYAYEDRSIHHIITSGIDSIDFFMVKIDLDTGEVLWRSQNIPEGELCNPVLVGDKLFLLVGSNLIYSLDTSNGNVLAKIQLGNDENSYDIQWNMTAHGDFLYFGFGTRYLARLSISTIDYGDQNIQVLLPEILWESKYKSRVMALPQIKDSIIYFMTYTQINRKPFEFTALDLNSMDIVWERTIDNEDGRGHLLLHGDIIYIMSNTVSAYTIPNGDLIYSRFFADNIFDDAYYAPGLQCNGSVMYNNRLYYTNSNFNTSGRYKAPNIVCLNASDGSTVWGRLAYHSFSLGTVPLLANGKLFLPLEDGLNVIDAETGELLGIDKKFYGSGINGVIFQYNNLMIFPNKENNGYRYIAVDISE